MSEEPRREGMQTRLIHGADALNGATSVSPPIYQTSTYRLPDPERGAEIAAEVAPAEYYTRYGSPNNKQVERVLAELEGAEAALVVGSGMAAISTALLSNLRAGDHVVAQRTHYTAALTLLTEIAPGFGIETTLVDQEDTAAFERAIRPNTKVLYTETPTNPTLALTDLAATAKLRTTSARWRSPTTPLPRRTTSARWTSATTSWSTARRSISTVTRT
ncbi:MAG: aminotransferase class I/II-fold pyridoxal phosphate-dependent enzyme [Chloroflexia bacterium]